MARFRTIPGAGYGNSLIDTLIWGGQIWDMADGPITVKLGTANSEEEWNDEIVPQTPHSDQTPFGHIYESLQLHDWTYRENWTEAEVETIAYVAGLYEGVAKLEFHWANDYSDANFVWWKTALPGDILAAHEGPDSYQDSAHQRWGYFDSFAMEFHEQAIGGDGLNTLIHEIGHGLGLAHPHDGGRRDDRTTFVGASDGSVGTLGQNQGVYTVMSYKPGHNSLPGDKTYGNQGGLGALDIAALQIMYGANTTHASGNDTYELPTQNTRGTGWLCIWDTGGIDTISAQKSTAAVTIDLRAATLNPNDPNAGGFLSRQSGIAGGLTIANKVVVENAVGGSGNDTLIGNAAANTLNGGLGNDTYHIDSPSDVIVDAGGIDTVYASFNYVNPAIENVYVNGVLAVSGGTKVVEGFANQNGGAGKDTLTGTDGNDKMYGYAGNDTLIGSKGTDIFVFNTKLNAKTNKDKVQAFVTKEDQVWLDNAIFKKLGKGTESMPVKLKKSFFKLSSKAGDGNDYILLDRKKGIASYDADGKGSGKAIAFAVFDKKALPALSDFFVV